MKVLSMFCNENLFKPNRSISMTLEYRYAEPESILGKSWQV